MKILANRTQGQWRAVGGRISVESDALYFTPNIIDIRLGGLSARIPKDDIRDITVEPRKDSLKEIFSGGLRNRLKIVRDNGVVDLFVVNRLSFVIADLKKWHEQK